MINNTLSKNFFRELLRNNIPVLMRKTGVSRCQSSHLDAMRQELAHFLADFARSLRGGFLCLCLGLSVLHAVASAGQAVVLDAKTKIEVLLSEKPSEAEQYAAQELSHYLGKILSTTIPVRKGSRAASGVFPLVVGWHPLNQSLKPETLGVEEAVVDVRPSGIHLVGGRGDATPEGSRHDRGSLYAVYDLLNRLGVRWYRPEDWGEHVPTLSRIELPVETTRSNQTYKYRGGFMRYQTFYPPLDKMTSEEREAYDQMRRMMGVWNARNRQNTWSVTTPDLGGGYGVSFAHAYNALVPPQRYFKTNPEFFALINGQRSSNPHAQLCVSNPEVEEVAWQNLRTLIQKSPTQTIFSVGPNDGHLWCECEPCRALDDPNLKSAHTGKTSMTNRVVWFANKLAKRVATEFPGKKVGWYAYSGDAETPTKVDKLEPNTAVMVVAFAGAFSDYSRKLYDPDSGPNARYAALLKDWRALSDKSGGNELLTHNYFSFYRWPGPLPVVDAMADRFAHFNKDYGIVGSYCETHPTWGPQGIGNYFYTWILANPYGDLQAELEKYYTNYYGPAAVPMRAYHELLEKEAQVGPYFGSGGFGIEALFTNELLARLEPMIHEAERLSESDPVYRRRVAGVAAGYHYAQKVRKFLNQKDAGKTAEAKKTLAALEKFYFSFEDGSVFDTHQAGKRSWRGIFSLYGKDIDQLAAQFALF